MGHFELLASCSDKLLQCFEAECATRKPTTNVKCQPKAPCHFNLQCHHCRRSQQHVVRWLTTYLRTYRTCFRNSRGHVTPTAPTLTVSTATGQVVTSFDHAYYSALPHHRAENAFYQFQK